MDSSSAHKPFVINIVPCIQEKTACDLNELNMEIPSQEGPIRIGNTGL